MASITISPREIKRFSAPDGAEPSELREMTERAEYLAVSVENLWDEMPPKMREALAALAYAIAKPPPKNIARRYRAAIRGGLWYARMRLQGEQDAFFDFVVAHRRLTHAIMAAIERDDPAYQQALSEAVEGAFSDLERGEALSPEETREQLRQLSDEALRELR